MESRVVANTEFATVGDTSIAYDVSGTGHPLLLLHAGLGDRRMWDAQFGTFARDFRVVRYDHRGFGNSTGADSVYSPTDDVIRLLDHLGIAKAHVVGNSVGGSVALDFAVLHPDHAIDQKTQRARIEDCRVHVEAVAIR